MEDPLATFETTSKGKPMVACGFELLPNKKLKLSLMLNKIFDLVRINSALSVNVSDVEQSDLALTVIRQGCQFHYRKAHIRRLGDYGLKEFYYGDVELNVMSDLSLCHELCTCRRCGLGLRRTHSCCNFREDRE